MVSTANLSPLFRCSTCSTRKLGVCRMMSTPDELRDLGAARAGYRNLAPNDELYIQGDRLGEMFIVQSGWLFLYQNLEDGRRQVLRILMPGDLFGAVVAGGRPADHGAEALTAATICVLPTARIARLRQRLPNFGEQILESIEQDAHAGMDMLTNLGRRNATERVARLLTDCLSRMRQKGLAGAGERNVGMPLSQVVLGDALGLTSIHVNRVLRSLREAGVLTLSRGRLTILDDTRLARLLGGIACCNPEADRTDWRRRRPSPRSQIMLAPLPAPPASLIAATDRKIGTA